MRLNSISAVIALAYGFYVFSEKRKKKNSAAPATQMTAALLHATSTDPAREGTTIGTKNSSCLFFICVSTPF